MTGEKNRYKTHEQLWKLDDGGLSTPQHDELVLQLINSNNAIKISTEYKNPTWNFKLERKDYDESILNAFNEELKRFQDQNSSYNTPIIKSEVPITSGYNNFIIGYIDVQLEFKNVITLYAVSSDFSPSKIAIYPDLSPSELYHFNILGTMKACNLGFQGFNEKTTIYNIEVKPKIK